MSKKNRRISKVTGGYTKPVETTVGQTLGRTPCSIIKTKRLIYDKMPINRHTTFKYKEYVFKFTSKLDPVPVEVPSHIADILLKMVDEGCRCHASAQHKLFREV